MSAPRSIDQLRRYSLRGSGRTGFWTWVAAALTAIGLLLVSVTIGYNWGIHDKRTAQPSPPMATGSAPSQQPTRASNSVKRD
jgi:hypothetical protein